MIHLRSRIALSVLCILASLVQPRAGTAADVPVPYSGFLTENGSPVNGTRIFTFTLQSPGMSLQAAAVQTETLSVVRGVFNTSLQFPSGSWGTPGDGATLDVAVEGAGSLGAVPSGAVPHAINAIGAETAERADTAGVLLNPPPMPGVGFTSRTTAISGSSSGTWNPIESITLTVPHDGYVWVEANGSIPGGAVRLFISEQTPPTNNSGVLMGLPAADSNVPYSTTRVIPATAGTHVYRLYLRGGTVLNPISVNVLNMQGMWIPSRYEP